MLSTQTLNKLIREELNEFLGFGKKKAEEGPKKTYPGINKVLKMILQAGTRVIPAKHVEKWKSGLLRQAARELISLQGAADPEEFPIKPARPAAPSVTQALKFIKQFAEKKNDDTYQMLYQMFEDDSAQQEIGFDFSSLMEAPDALPEKEGEKKAEAEEEGEASEATPDTEALVNLLDPIADEWTKISKETKDENLKKAMNYIERVALSEAQELDRWKVLSGIK